MPEVAALLGTRRSSNSSRHSPETSLPPIVSPSAAGIRPFLGREVGNEWAQVDPLGELSLQFVHEARVEEDIEAQEECDVPFGAELGAVGVEGCGGVRFGLWLFSDAVAGRS